MRLSVKAWAALLASVTVSAQQIDSAPPPRRLVDIGGRKLHLNCTVLSRTGPTVILEAGASSAQWGMPAAKVRR
jgi:hypothetical protein